LLSKLTPYAGGTNNCFQNQFLTLVAHPYTRGTTLRWQYKQLLSESISTLAVQPYTGGTDATGPHSTRHCLLYIMKPTYHIKL